MHSLIHNQLQSRSYRDMILWAWHNTDPLFRSDELDDGPPPRMAHSISFGFEPTHTCEQHGCQEPAFIRCSHCGSHLCIRHFLERVCFHEETLPDDEEVSIDDRCSTIDEMDEDLLRSVSVEEHIEATSRPTAATTTAATSNTTGDYTTTTIATTTRKFDGPSSALDLAAGTLIAGVGIGAGVESIAAGTTIGSAASGAMSVATGAVNSLRGAVNAARSATNEVIKTHHTIPEDEIPLMEIDAIRAPKTKETSSLNINTIGAPKTEETYLLDIVTNKATKSEEAPPLNSDTIRAIKTEEAPPLGIDRNRAPKPEGTPVMNIDTNRTPEPEETYLLDLDKNTEPEYPEEETSIDEKPEDPPVQITLKDLCFRYPLICFGIL